MILTQSPPQFLSCFLNLAQVLSISLAQVLAPFSELICVLLVAHVFGILAMYS
jgi:hypothetical protein